MNGVLSILLAMLMVASNVGISLTTHYCGGKAIGTALSFFGHSDIDCGMGDEETACKDVNTTNLYSHCCDNQFLDLIIEDDFNSSSDVGSSISYKFVTAFILARINFNYSCEVLGPNRVNSSPPLLNLDIPVLIQSFLL